MHYFQQKRFLLPLVFIIVVGVWTDAASPATASCGPVNLLKTMPTPFGAVTTHDTVENSAGTALEEPISINAPDTTPINRSLSARLAVSRVYLPGWLIMGKPAEFIVKGKPGYHAALAMADRDSGAKPIAGHAIHLGADRKVVSVGIIPENGLLHLWIEAPFEGDLIGLPLFFEVAVWSKADYSDLEIASPVKSDVEGATAENFHNGVIMAAAEGILKKDPLVVRESATTTMQHLQDVGPRLDSGRP